MGRNAKRRIYIPKDAVILKQASGSLAPVRYWGLLDAWLDGTRLDKVACDANLTMSELEELFRSMVLDIVYSKEKRKGGTKALH